MNDLESLAAGRRRVRRQDSLLWIVAGAAVLLGLILFLSGKHQDKATFVASIYAPTVHLTVPATIEFHSLTGTAARFAGLIDGNATHRDSVADGSTPLDRTFLVGETGLQSFVAPAGADVSLSREPQSDVLHVHVECQSARLCSNAHFLGVTGLRVPATMRRTGGKVPPTRAVRLQMDGPTADVSIQLRDSLPVLILSDAEVAAVSFLDLRENPAASGLRRLAWSGVQGGSIRLLATDRETTLGEGEWVSIVGDGLRLNQVVAKDSGLSIQIRGEASELQTSTGGYIRNLKPTLMDALVSAYQRKIQTAWAIMYIGVLFALRALAFFLGDR